MRLKETVFVCAFFFIVQLVCAQSTQWASGVVEKSSEYSASTYGAIQALGAPNVLPRYVDSPCAWSPLAENSVTEEYIHLRYATPMRIRQIAIAQSHNMGAIAEVWVYSVEGKEEQVYWSTKDKEEIGKKSLMLIEFPETAFEVSEVKVILDAARVPGWNHIDAIGISDSKEAISIEIPTIPGLTFAEGKQRLGEGINSQYDEIMPVVSSDGKKLFFDRKDHPKNMTGKGLNDDIWYSVLNENNEWTKAKNIGSPLNNPGHNFIGSVFNEGKSLLLANVYLEDGTMESGVSLSHLVDGEWSFPEEILIEDYYNLNRYSEFRMSEDGKVLILAIEREDGLGGKDIHVSLKTESDKWSAPQNLGPNVNSAGTQMAPMLWGENRFLFFSSNGHRGYGSNDLFVTYRQGDSWTDWAEPMNLGSDINTKDWDGYFSVTELGDVAYLSAEVKENFKTDLLMIKLPDNFKEILLAHFKQ